MHPTGPDELDQFKSRINLTEYAAALRYVIDRRASSRNSVVMRGPGNDKIVVAINGATGHWIYCSVQEDLDNGTIVDFAQKRLHLSLGEVQKELQPWIGLGSRPPRRPPKGSYADTLEPSSEDLARVTAAYTRMQPLHGRHAYLEEECAIPAAVLADPRFADKIRVDERGNAVFPHYNASGLCGYELKNHNFNGFSGSSQKGLWASAANRADTALAVVKSVIDALSYHAIRRPAGTRLISIDGAINPEQSALIKAAIEHLPPGGRLVIATANDGGGDELAEQVKAIAAGIQPDITVAEDRPPLRGHDWNNVLQQGANLYILASER